MTSFLHSLVIQTPEGCSFSLPLAGPISRFLAWLIDLLLVIGLVVGLVLGVSLLGVLYADLAGAVFYIGSFAIWIGYSIFMEWFWRGRTIGKRLLRLQVIDEYALRLTFPQVVIRNLLRMADMLPGLYLVGGLSCVLSRKLQRLGDMVAGTVVIRTRTLALPDLVEVGQTKFNSFRQYSHLTGRLRQRTSGAEAQLVLMSLMRRQSLDAQARLELFAGLAQHFRQIVQFPQDATDGLSDEQYVRNVVEILFASTKSLQAS